MIIISLFVTFFLLLASNAYAVTYYVSKTGSDSNTCTQAQNPSTPKLTIANASGGRSCLSAGSTLIIGNGTYAERLQSSPSGTDLGANAVKYQAQNPLGVMVRPSTSGSGPIDLQNSAYHHIIFDGIIFDGTNVDFQVVKISGGAHHIRIANGEIRNSPVGGVIIADENTDFNEIVNNKIYNNGTSHGVYDWGGNTLIDGNEVYNNGRYGIHAIDTVAWPNPTRSHDTVIRNNIVHNNGVFNTSAWGILIGGLSSGQVYNNIVYDDIGGIYIHGLAVNTKVFNNTIYNVGTANGGIFIQSTNSGVEVRNNIVYLSNIINSSGGNATVTNNFTSNPLFTNPGAGDFSLQSGSGAINAGTSVVSSIVTDDIVDTPRPQGGSYDIGAYEFTSVISPSVTTDKLSYSFGETIVVTADDGPGNSQEWVGLFLAASADNSNIDWFYHNGTKTAPGSAPTHPFVVNFTAPSVVGTYNVRYFPLTPSTDKLATSSNFTIEGADTDPPSTPSNLTATAASSSQINLSWTGSTDEGSGVSHYEIERCQGLGCTAWAQIDTTESTTHNDSVGLIYGTLYRYRVRAVDNDSNPSGYSNIDDDTTSDIDISTFLVAHYAFEGDASDETATHNASNVGTPTYTDGQIGQAISFNGTSSALSVTHATALSLVSDMTLVFWLYVDTLPASGQFMKIIHKETGATTSAPYAIDIKNTSGTSNFSWYHHTDGQSYMTLIFTAYVVPTDVWVHVGFVRKNTPKTVDLYIDGELVDSEAWTTDNPAANTGVVAIAYNSVGNSQFLDGSLDDLRLYSMAISGADVLEMSTLASLVFAGPPTLLSETAGSSISFPGPPTTISETAGSTPTFPGAPGSLSETASSSVPSFPGPPTNLGSQ